MRAWSAIVLSILLAGCAKERAERRPEPKHATSSDAPEVLTTAPPAPPLFERQSAPAIAPAQVPVEEDFIAGAEERIGKRVNLEVELTRLAQEISSSSD